ncbi:MAG: ATP-binding protein [Candidatus Cloacimonetes bacterium]|nr:ATP-binding protein [Candidatus Cloacimonadota bacterium]
MLSSDYLKTKDKILTQIKNSIPAIKKVGTDGVEFDLTNKVDYLSEFTRVINLIDLGENKLIFLLDEFSQTVENIRECEGEKNAIHFLQTNRGLRQTLSDKILFVYSGSIGLECIVESLNAIATINDITPIKIKPFSSIDAKKMITLLLEKLEFTIEDNIIDYMLNEIEWLIPFYIQLTMFALKEIKREEGLTVISESIIDKAFQEMIEQKHYFEHWHTRLKNPKNPELYNYAKELLNIISEFGYIESNEVYNLAVKYNIENEYKNILGTLVYDGYINNDDNLKTYRFNSPILKMWWWKYVAN